MVLSRSGYCSGSNRTPTAGHTFFQADRSAVRRRKDHGTVGTAAVQALEHTKKADFEPMVWWCKSAHRDECAKSVLRRRKARLCSQQFSRYPQKTPEFSQFDATMEWCRLWPKRNGGAASTQTSNQTLNRWFGGANRPAETNAQDRCQSAERRVSVPGNSLVYPRRTPEFSQLDATIEWWRLWPKRSGGAGSLLRTRLRRISR